MFSYHEKIAFEKGYRVNGLKLYGLNKNERNFCLSTRGYPRFTITTGSRTDGTRRYHQVMVHRLVAYQKYGDKIYEDGIEVRHKDGDATNYLEDNVLIGTKSENAFDKSLEVRKKMAGNANKKISDEKVIEIKKYHSGSYKDTMEKFSINSSGTLWYIMNKR